MLIPGVDFTTIGKVADAYFKCVNDNGGINGRPIKYKLYNEQLNPTQQASLAKKLIESDKVVGDRRQHELHRVRHQLEVLQVQGLHRDRRRRAGGVLRHADLRRVEHGPALQQHRRGAGARQARREVAHGRLARHDLGVRRRRRAQGRAGGRHHRQGLPDQAPDHGRQLDDPAARAGGGRRRRRHPRLHARLGAGPDAGGRSRRASSTRCCGAPRRRSPTSSWRSSSRSSTARCTSTRSSATSTRRLARRGALRADHEEVRAEDPAPGVRPDGLHGREVRDPGAAEHQGRRSPRSRTTRRANLKNVKTEHALQAVVRRQEPRLPHPEQLGHHRRPTRAARS